jgi:hypothetical protein
MATLKFRFKTHKMWAPQIEEHLEQSQTQRNFEFSQSDLNPETGELIYIVIPEDAKTKTTIRRMLRVLFPPAVIKFDPPLVRK